MTRHGCLRTPVTDVPGLNTPRQYAWFDTRYALLTKLTFVISKIEFGEEAEGRLEPRT